MVHLDRHFATVLQSQFAVLLRIVENSKAQTVCLNLMFTTFQDMLDNLDRIRTNCHRPSSEVCCVPLRHLLVAVRKV